MHSARSDHSSICLCKATFNIGLTCLVPFIFAVCTGLFVCVVFCCCCFVDVFFPSYFENQDNLI